MMKTKTTRLKDGETQIFLTLNLFDVQNILIKNI